MAIISPSSKYKKFFRVVGTNNPMTGARVWAIPTGATFNPSTHSSFELVEHPTKLGWYEGSAGAHPDGEYDSYIDTSGGTTAVISSDVIHITENRLTVVADHFDAADDLKLKGTGIKDYNITTDLIANNNVTEDKLANSSVTENKLGTDAVAAIKVKPDVAGEGLVKNGVTKALDVNVDDDTLEIATDVVQVKALGVDTAELTDLGVTEGKLSADVQAKLNSVAGGGMVDPMTTRGDIIYHGGIGPVRLPIGAIGKVLKVVDIGASEIPQWADEAGGGSADLAGTIPLQFHKLGFPQSLYLNTNSDNEDYAASKLTIVGLGADYLELNGMPDVQEIIAAAQYEVFVYNTASGSDGQACDYTARAVVTSANKTTWRLYVDSVVGFSIGHTIAINVHYRDTDWYPHFTPDLTDNSDGNSFAGSFIDSAGDLIAMSNGLNAAGVLQTMAYKADDDYLSGFTVMNSGSAVIAAAGGHAGGILITPRPYRLGGQDKWITACMIRPNISADWSISTVEFDEDFSNTTVNLPFSFPDPPKGAPANGWQSASLARKSSGGWKIFVVARTLDANSDMAGGTGHYRTWTVEEYWTDDVNLANTPTWVWKRTVLDPAADVHVDNDVSFVHGYVDSVTYFEHEGAEFLLVGGTTWKALSGIGSNRSFGFMQFDGANWVRDRHGATIVAPAKHIDLSTGTKYDNLTYLHDHLGGYPQLVSFKGLSYIFLSSKSSTGNYYTGLAKLKAGIEFQSEGDSLTKNPFNDDRQITAEDLGGTKNGVNQTFTIPHPIKAGSEKIYLDGRRIDLTTGYTISGLTVTTVGFAPLATESFKFDAIKE